MADVVNRRITLAARPVGFPKDSDFGLVEDTVSEPAEGELLLQTLYLSLDPYTVSYTHLTLPTKRIV